MKLNLNCYGEYLFLLSSMVLRETLVTAVATGQEGHLVSLILSEPTTQDAAGPKYVNWWVFLTMQPI